MSKQCTVCFSPKLLQVNRLRAGRHSLAVIAAKTGLTLDALKNHFKFHAQQALADDDDLGQLEQQKTRLLNDIASMPEPSPLKIKLESNLLRTIAEISRLKQINATASEAPAQRDLTIMLGRVARRLKANPEAAKAVLNAIDEADKIQ